ncbi:MBL fold metallo-hydrolase [Candidatus Uhrbacteria bacterium]|nr:MBL fold metallo-hydrolase [Candidatus Uhrbacteria bacterium]
MIFQWYGHACFRLQANGQDATILIDPYDASIGWKLPRISADIVLVSTDIKEHSAIDTVKKTGDAEPFIIKEAGEYEVRGVLLHALPVGNTRIFVIRADDMAILHCGTLNRSFTEEELDSIGRVDILIVPVGGGAVLDARKASDLVNELEPRVVIPMQYRLAGLKKTADPLDPFLKELGMKRPEAVDKFKILKKDLPAEDMLLVECKPV